MTGKDLIGKICQYKIEDYGKYIPTDYPMNVRLEDFMHEWEHDKKLAIPHMYLAKTWLKKSEETNSFIAYSYSAIPPIRKYPPAQKNSNHNDDDLSVLRKLISFQLDESSTQAEYLYPTVGPINEKYLAQEPWRPGMRFAMLEESMSFSQTVGLVSTLMQKYMIVPMKLKTFTTYVKNTKTVLCTTEFLYCSISKPSDEDGKIPKFIWLRPAWIEPGNLASTYETDFKVNLRKTIKSILKK